MHILVLTDRDWTHPQGGGTGANLYGQVSRWLAWGHRVSIVACSYPGAKSFERIGLARDPPAGRALDRLPPRHLQAMARPRPGPRRRARGGERHHLPHPGLDAHAAGHPGAPHPPPPLPGGARAPGRRGGARARDDAAAAALPGLALHHDLQRDRRGDRGDRDRPRPDRRELHRRRARRLRAGRAGGGAHPALPRAAQALQAHRRAARRARTGARGRARRGRGGRSPRRARGGDRRARAPRPGADARARGRGAQARAAPALVGRT